MQEQLAGMGAALTDLDLVTVILGSLPKSYHPLINAISMSSAHVKVTLEPTKVVKSLIDEFECLSNEECQLKSAENTLAAAGTHGKSHGKGGPKTEYTDTECWKCRKKGHICNNCHSKKTKKDGKDGEAGKAKDSANAAAGGEEFTFTMTFTGTTLTQTNKLLSKSEIDVYDSGASAHMSPTQS